ncbi:MAG: SDR family NAD(P)-dependent oxidoreductase [Eggerthellaceae bacterium]
MPETGGALRRFGPRFEADVSSFEAAVSLLEGAACALGLRVLVNNAGITKDGLMMRMKEEDFDRVIAVNLKGTYNCSRAASIW